MTVTITNTPIKMVISGMILYSVRPEFQADLVSKGHAVRVSLPTLNN